MSTPLPQSFRAHDDNALLRAAWREPARVRRAAAALVWMFAYGVVSGCGLYLVVALRAGVQS